MQEDKFPNLKILVAGTIEHISLDIEHQTVEDVLRLCLKQFFRDKEGKYMKIAALKRMDIDGVFNLKDSIQELEWHLLELVIHDQQISSKGKIQVS